MNMDHAFKVVLGVLMLALTTMASVAADRAGVTNSSLNDLAQSVVELTTTVTVLTERVENLPPPDLLLRVDRLEQQVAKLEDKL